MNIDDFKLFDQFLQTWISMFQNTYKKSSSVALLLTKH